MAREGQPLTRELAYKAQSPTHFEHRGTELRPDHARPVKERVAEIMVYGG
jgi:hypothetical protein